ncbi:solute carrier family 15 member 1-like [Lampetra fluviatilis]
MGKKKQPSDAGEQLGFSINAMLILVLVPLFDVGIYPLLRRCKVNFTPLRRITVGMLFLGVAFVVAGVIQIMVDNSLTKFPGAGEARFKLLNLQSGANVSLRHDESSCQLSAPPHAVSLEACTIASSGQTTLDLSLSFTGGASWVSCPAAVSSGSLHTLLVRNHPSQPCKMLEDISKKPEQGKNLVRFINALDVELTVTMGDVDYGAVQGLSNSSYHEILKGEKTNIQVKDGNSSVLGVFVENIGFGGSYTILLYENAAGELLRRSEVDIQPNSVHMGWQVPQYLLLTIGEVIFSVTGLEFSYSQAPPNMKSVLQAAWLLTVAFGNIIVLIVAEAGQMTQQYAEFFLFAGLLFALSVLFAVMAYFYTYVDPAEVEREFDRLDQEEERRRASGGGGEEKSKDEHRGGMELAGVYDEPLKQTKM